MKKTKIKLVTNRPVSESLAKAVEASQVILTKHPEQVSMALLKQQLMAEQFEEIERLHNASKLKTTEFCAVT